MTASRDSAECNAAGQVCVGTAAIAALRPYQGNRLPGAETRTAHITSKRVKGRLKWDEWNGSAENMRLESCPPALTSVTPYLALFLHDLTISKLFYLCQHSEFGVVDTQSLFWEVGNA